MNNFADIDHKLNEYVCKYESNKNNHKRTTIKENVKLNQSTIMNKHEQNYLGISNTN